MTTLAKRPPKTVKEKAFTQEYIKTGNATEAASRVYDVKNRDVARNIGAQNVAKLSFVEYFNTAGLTDGAMIQSLVEATQATKNNNPDWQIRLKAIELCMKLKGTFQQAEKELKDNYVDPRAYAQTEEQAELMIEMLIKTTPYVIQRAKELKIDHPLLSDEWRSIIAKI